MSEPNRPILLDDVARLSGVSRATASRALGSKAGVADDVRIRVRAIADSVGYRPNRAAQRLAGARTGLIGLLLGDTVLYRNPYSARLVDAMAKSAEQLDQGLLLVMSEHEPGRAVRNLISDRMVDGVIVSSVVFGERWAEDLLDSQLAKVLIGAHPLRQDLATVTVENVASTTLLINHLFDTGCERIGMITGPTGRSDGDDRRRGFEVAHQEHGVPVDPDLIIEGNYQRSTGFSGAMALLDKGVDAIFASNDTAARGVIDACRQRGVAVPDDVSVVGFDGVSAALFEPYKLTTAVQPFEALARAALGMIVESQDGQIELQCELQFGTTTRPVSG